MKAVVCRKFGPPEVLHIEEVEKPAPGDKEVLIRVHAAAVVREEPGMRRGPGLNGFLKPKAEILGQELAGVVEAAGKEVTRFRAGDRVYGETGMALGAYAEYKCMAEDSALALIPEGMSFEEAAAIPNGALTALPFLRDKGKMQAGQHVLVYGASGAVGTAAVQLAAASGAKVTGVCSTANLELVTSLGAEQVIDYTEEDIRTCGRTFDIIFDTSGKISYPQCRSLLKEKGVFLSTVLTPSIVLWKLLTAPGGGKKAGIIFAGLKPAAVKAEYLAFLNTLIGEGKLKAVIDRRYPMEELAEAHRHVEKGHKKGNVIITISE